MVEGEMPRNGIGRNPDVLGLPFEGGRDDFAEGYDDQIDEKNRGDDADDIVGV